MQFHLNGFIGSGDPLKLQYEGNQEPDFQGSLPEEVDVLIVGAGPAGQLLAAQLAQFPDITTRIVEPKPGRLEKGQADGLQCRSLEIFEAFGFADKVLKEAYWVNETTFWSPSEDGTGLTRSGRIRDTDEGLSEMPHVILNQARLHDFWLEAMKWSPTRLEPSYSRRMVDLKRPSKLADRAEVTIERVDPEHQGQKEVVRAKYVVGCDGSRSGVRNALGLEMRGDYQNQPWGVVDALVVTDFPDYRLKTIIHSATKGSVVIIPREGGYMVRLYIELDKLNPDERVSTRNITQDFIIERARQIFEPFTLEAKEVSYCSVYEVGQRLTDHFDDVPKNETQLRNPRIFITGDACHTHSAKAGQGMNVSMNDSYNLGWKLASVLRGQSDAKILHTYSNERHAIAKTLIDFDREISRLYAAKPQRNASADDADVVDPSVFQATFQKQNRWTAGVETKYPAGLLTSGETANQHLATGFEIGTRFHSCRVVRLADAKPLHLGHTLRADGRWRVLLFAPDTQDPREAGESDLHRTCEYLKEQLLPRYTAPDADIDSVIDVRAVLPDPIPSVVASERQKTSSHSTRTNGVADGTKDNAEHEELESTPGTPSSRIIEPTSLHPLLLPRKGRFGLPDYEKVFVDAPSYNFGFGDLYKRRGLSRERGCLMLVRPDQYISGVWPLGPEGWKGLEEFLEGFMIARQ